MFRTLNIFLGLSLIAFLRLRILPDIRAHRGTKKMESDSQGNYDLDGVSYDPDTYNVVVTGDGQAPAPVAEVKVVEAVVTMHAPEEPKKRSITA